MKLPQRIKLNDELSQFKDELQARFLYECEKHDGTVCFEEMRTWKTGYITQGLFREFLKRQVQSGKICRAKNDKGYYCYFPSGETP